MRGFFITIRIAYFLFNTAVISIDKAERSIFNFPDIVSITIVVSANSAIFP